jgi:hypothetical protein
MVVHAFVLLVAVQQGGTPPQQPQQSPVARIVVHPAQRTVTAGDTLRLRAEALDAAGRPVGNAQIRFQAAGGRFEGAVEPDGLFRSGSTGTIPVTVVATVPGSAPAVERIEIEMVPGRAARIDVSPAVTRLLAGQSLPLRAQSFSAAGDVRNDAFTWSSSAPAVATVRDGVVRALAPGRAVIAVRTGDAERTVPIEVVENAIASLEVTPERTQARTGDVIRFAVTARDAAGRAITGFTPTWSLSPGHGVIEADGGFVGYETGDYLISANLGGRTAVATVRLEPRDVAREIRVLGRLPRTLFTTEEVWVHPNGEVAYLGTGGGGDRMYTIDIRDPSNPVVTDSLVVNTRRVNDLMTTPDGRFLVFTRENSSDRRSGIVIASLDDPRHPRIIANFTDGVTAGVHSTFVYHQPQHGTHVYATNNGTGALHIIDISDPYNPREAARWMTEGRPDAGRSLHDVDVQDGLAYLSYWNDNLVILDIGNGVKGGSPTNPQLVSQFRYDLNALYRNVEITSGPGFIRGTHTAWRHRDYVFIADEVFPAGPVQGATGVAAGGAYGRLQVIDVSDLENPRSIAWFEPEIGGVHNVWVAGDTLYLGAYNGGFHAFDVSGELRGDIAAQGRRIAHLMTADMDGVVPNAPMTWGVVVKDGLMYINDMHTGLWIARLEPRRPPIP